MLLGGVALLLQPHPPQPVGRRRRPQPLAVHLLLHQFRRLLQVGQGAAPQRQPGQPGGAQQLPQHRREPLARQAAGQLRQLQGQAIPALRRGPGDLLGAPAQQGRGRQQPLAAGQPRAGQGVEQPLQRRRPRAFKHIAAAHQAAGQLPLLQGTAQGLGLIVAAHQQAEVARPQRPLLLPLLQQQAALQQLLAQGRHLRFELLGVEVEPLQRCFPLGQQQAPLARLRLHRWHRQSGALQPGGHQGVETRHQGR